MPARQWKTSENPFPLWCFHSFMADFPIPARRFCENIAMKIMASYLSSHSVILAEAAIQEL
jgi:hypothetical protein